MFSSKSWNSRPEIPSRAQNTIFYLDGLSVDFGSIQALKSVQLSISAGEIIFITGASGAGKSTLLKVLAGLTPPTQGRFLGPENLFCSIIFQDLRLLENRSCEDNIWVSYDPSLYKTKNSFYHEALELSRLLGIQDKLNMKIKDANGGLKQKVAIVRSLLSRPDVLLADEPTSSLDFDNANKLFEVLNYYNYKRGLTVVWATHNKELVKSFSGRMAHLDGGKLVYSGHACFI